MDILVYKPAHDGSLVLLKDNKLIFSIEGEKDSGLRYSGITIHEILKILQSMDNLPDVIVLGDELEDKVTIKHYEYPYHGVEDSHKRVEEMIIGGKKISIFSSSHERSHIFSAYGMSPFPQGKPYYSLCWEGSIGTFHLVNPDLTIKSFDTVLNFPGMRYSMPYYIAQKEIKSNHEIWNPNMAGKTMALAAYGRRDPSVKRKWQPFIDRFLDYKIDASTYLSKFTDYIHFARKLPINRIGLEHQKFRDFMYHYSEAIFDRFYQFAKKNLTEHYPLLISGGCGLNCDWNTKWKESGLFSDIFIPPCTNDSGNGIGYAVDALHHFTGNAKIEWSPYAGENFVNDTVPGEEFTAKTLDYGELAGLLSDNLVFAWVQGKYEIGPRALCNRSLIAAPFKKEMNIRLNKIKHRESYRPIAPVCTEESVSKFFKWQGESPYMLQFCEVNNPNLKAVTHVDNSARVQTVRADQNPQMHQLLKKFEEKTNYPVLCNTSLNFLGKGFINRTSGLITYVLENDVDGMVIGDKLYIKK